MTKVCPIGNKVVVERAKGQEMIGDIVIPDVAQTVPQEGTVVAVGNGATNRKGVRIPIDVNVGDQVLFNRYAGDEIEVDGKPLLILKDTDVMGIIAR
jgi:chaperonin GroES